MALQTTTTLFIGGLEIPVFKRITLHQQIDAHHMLELVCRMDVLEDLSLSLGESSKNFLGETLTIQTRSLDAFGGYKELEFKGVVTQVKTIKGHEASSGDSVVIKAQSPSFLADDGPHYASHNDVSLSEIIEKTFNDYDKSKLEVLVQPKNNPTLHYSVQHNESAYDYASRLAAQYGEWFYYNGSQLVFGTPDTKELALTYGFDLKEYHLSLLPQSHNYKYFSNDYLLNEVHEKDAKEVTSGANGYSGFVSNKANSIFNKETKIWHNLYNDPKAKQRLDSSIEAQKKAIEIKQVKLNGVSDNPGVTLGSIVTVEGANYRITNITHTNNENGDYQNRFEAITADFDAYPNTNINAYPKSETQTAIVMENADPEGLGRIRVQFPWQKITGEMTPWIRIVTPHAGGDKGFHFIPETGEEVLVGFEGGNAEHPYMMGSLYNGSGKAGAFQNSSNAIKAIQTRSGNKIILNDDSGSIDIVDSNGSCIKMDGAGNISITASKKIKMLAQDIEFIARHNLSAIAGNIATLSARPGDGGGEGQVIVSAEKDLNIESKTTNASINTKEKFEIKSKSIDITAENDLKLNGGQMADFVASIIKINS
ncbi:phage baseplate assembly protein V [Olleya sp. AS48]|uniref:type VI secretion system Vgr family protein n=2 Tax=unclassified Olleya TaxID=2615019 RepID=UPI00316EEF39